MLTNKARLAVIGVAVILFCWTLFERTYEISAVVAFSIGLLAWGYFKHGTVLMASKAFHNKDYDQTEKLLKEIKDPDRLSKSRRGFYEFMYGNIELKRNNLVEAERHFQLASRFPLRNENDKAIILVQLANLNLRKHEFIKVKAYLDTAKTFQISSRVQDIIDKIEKEIPEE